MNPRFRQREIVRVAGRPGRMAGAGYEGVVEDLAGPNDDGTGWNVTLRIGEAGAQDVLLLLPETDLQPTGLVEDENGDRVPLETAPPPDEHRDRLELRLVTDVTNGIDAARVAATIERELLQLVGAAAIAIEAERHWSDPYNYELVVAIEPLDDPVAALRELAEAGGDGWLCCDDDGWRCDLWWSDTEEENALFLVPEVRGAGVAFLPWRSPRRRPDNERPLVDVRLPGSVEEPHELDTEPGDEEP